jgi:hypothetical protein
MPDTDLELAARFVAVLYTVTNGRPGQFRRIDDCAARAGITRAADLSRRKARAEWLALIPGAHDVMSAGSERRRSAGW